MLLSNKIINLMKRLNLEERRKILITQKIQSNPKAMKFIIIGLSILLVVLFVEIWVVNRTSTYGDEIYKLKQAQASLELENQVLSNKIAQKSSMILLEKKANILGFNTISQIEYIKSSGKLASAE